MSVKKAGFTYCCGLSFINQIPSDEDMNELWTTDREIGLNSNARSAYLLHLTEEEEKKMRSFLRKWKYRVLFRDRKAKNVLYFVPDISNQEEARDG